MRIPDLLVNRADIQSLAYLIVYPLLCYWQWRNGFSLWCYVATLMVSVGVGVIHHNHTHLPMWRSSFLNRVTDYWLTLLQGHPPFVFHSAHIENHHRYHHGPLDQSRTYRFGGDHNHLAGYLCHPFQAVRALCPLLKEGLERDRESIFQMSLVGILWMILAFISPVKFTVFVLLPQLHGIHWLLGANYLQHAHADGNSEMNLARNFTGFMNRVWLNIGFHTAHHLHPRAHWSNLRSLHQCHQNEIDRSLLESSLIGYIIRVYFLSFLLPRYRSQTLMLRASNEIKTAVPNP
jgi:fatty acid desaturase